MSNPRCPACGFVDHAPCRACVGAGVVADNQLRADAPYDPEAFTLGVQGIPDWFVDRVSTGDITLYGERGFLAYISIYQGENPPVQRVRGDMIERRWLDVVLRRKPNEVEA